MIEHFHPVAALIVGLCSGALSATWIIGGTLILEMRERRREHTALMERIAKLELERGAFRHIAGC